MAHEEFLFLRHQNYQQLFTHSIHGTDPHHPPTNPHPHPHPQLSKVCVPRCGQNFQWFYLVI